MAHVNTPKRGLGAAAALALLTLTACSDGSDSKASSATIESPAGSNSNGDRSLSGGTTGAAPVDINAADPGTALPTQVVTPGDHKLVIVMTVGVEVADTAVAVDKVIGLAAAHGGQLYNSSLDLTDPLTAAGDLVFKLPPTEVDAFLHGLEEGIGRRTGLQGTTSDVTTQLSDLDAQILTAQKSVERVRALLTSAKDLGEVITLEGELSTRETHLEQLLAQQSGLDGQVAMATITVHLTTAPPAAAAASKKDKGIGSAFRSGWRAFLLVLFAFVLFVGYTAPFLLIGAVVLLVAWGVNRRRPGGPSRNRSAVPQPPPAPDEDPHTSSPDYADAARNP
jgi:hypothetical protein